MVHDVMSHTGVSVALEPLANGRDISGQHGSTRVLDVGGCNSGECNVVQND